MTNISTPPSIALMPDLEAAWQDVDISFDRFCLVAGIGAMEQVLREDAQRLGLTDFLMCGTAPLSRHHCAKVWSLRQPHEREPFHAADYHHRSGFGQASISGPWR